jgi:hypothetical protein
MDLKEYRIIEKRDCNTGEVYGLILLNRKHTVEEFQKEIYRAKNKCYDFIQEYGDDWYYITKEIGSKFDYIEIDMSSDDYIEF